MEILIIEDQEEIQNGYKRLLRSMFDNPTIRVANNADLAIGELALTDFNHIISDYNLIGSTGADVLDWIKVHRPHLVDRFIFVSGTEDVDLTGLHHRCLEKPASRQQLREALLG